MSKYIIFVMSIQYYHAITALNIIYRLVGMESLKEVASVQYSRYY